MDSGKTQGEFPLDDLHRQMAPALLRLARAMLRDSALAEDAVQEAFALLSVKLEEIPPHQRPGWLVRTTQYSAMNLRRSRQRQGQLEQAWLLREGTTSYQTKPAQADEVELSEQLFRVGEALKRLPDAQQQIVRLRLVENMTFEQIANRLGLPLGTVLSRMRLAMDKLRSMLHE